MKVTLKADEILTASEGNNSHAVGDFGGRYHHAEGIPAVSKDEKAHAVGGLLSEVQK